MSTAIEPENYDDYPDNTCFLCGFHTDDVMALLHHAFQQHPECELCRGRYPGTLDEHLRTAHPPTNDAEFDRALSSCGVRWWFDPGDNDIKQFRESFTALIAEGDAQGISTRIVDNLDDPVKPWFDVWVDAPGDDS